METQTHLPRDLTPPALRRLGEVEYELVASAGMRVPARVFADEVLLAQMLRDRSFRQLMNVACLPTVVDAVYGMPDMHEGYGFPVGGVAATEAPHGLISPGGIGFDINCGVRLLASTLKRTEVLPMAETLVHEFSRSIPAGMGRASDTSFDPGQMARVLEEGVPYLVRELGFGTEEDIEFVESGGCLPGGRAQLVSPHARDRGHTQLGTLGGGNHFVELQVVDAIFDADAASRLGLGLDTVTVLIHTGSRGLGHQVCTDHVRQMDRAMARHGIHVEDRQLACAPLSSVEGQAYFGAMCAAANFGFCNRHLIACLVRGVFERVVGHGGLRLVYDVAHNTAKLERYGDRILCVHRKGATRAFGPSSEELPLAYRGLGQPVLIPGSMGTASYVLLGTDRAQEISFASACHGAGRAMSRGAAKRAVTGSEVRRQLAAQGIVVRCTSNAELAEEAPLAYKDAARVVDVVHRAGIARKVARLRPIGVVKG